MYRTYQILALLLISAFHFHYALASQPNFEIDPCDLVLYGRDIYGNHYPKASDFPVAPAWLPVEFYLNKSIPEQYRPTVYEAASEWNTRVGFQLIIIRDQVDTSEWDTQLYTQQSPKNVIY